MRCSLRLALLAAAAIAASADDGLILHYPLTETSGTVAVDASGNGRNGTFVGGPQLNGAGGVRLDGIDNYVRLPNNIMKDLTSMTISTQALVRAEQTGNYFIFGLGVSSNGIGNGYVFATGNPYRAAISPGNWAAEAESKSSSNLPRDVWKTLTYVINGTKSASLYLDGTLVAGLTNSNPLVTPASLGGGVTSENYIGRSLYTADNLFAGSVRDFRIYNRALAASEIADLVPTDTERVEVALAGLSVTNVADVRGNLFLPTTSDGLNVTWSSSRSSVIAADGVVHRQSTDTTVTLTASIQYNGISRQRTFTALVRKAVEVGEFEGYAFAYFTGNSISGEKIYFAASEGNDALTWVELNGGQPVLTSTMDTTGLRDPFLIRSPEGDTFYLIATDLSIGSGTSWSNSVRTGSRYIEVWESHDLITWSAQRHALVSPATAGNTWAPEAYYDDDLGSYVVFWASSLYDEDDTSHSGSTYHRMLYVTTRDFVTFSDPVIWQDAGMSRIDSTVIKADGVYFRFTKDEGASGTGCSDIIQERSSELLATLESWTTIDTCIGRDAGTSAVEGPTTFKSNPGDVNGDKYYLFVDEYGGRGYIPLETADIANPSWKVSSSYNLPTSPRHGTVIPITAAELASLTGALSKTKRREVVPNRKRADGEILYYDFQSLSGGLIADMSGNGHHGTVYGGATVQNGTLTLDGVDDYIDLPDNLLAGVADITVEAEVMIDSSQGTPYFIWGIGNTDSSGQGNGYLFTTGDVYRTSIALGNWQTEQTASSGSSLTKNTWVHLAYTLEGSTATLYLNGIQVASNADVTNDPEDIGSGTTAASYIGRSMYSSDKYMKGKIRKFAIYNRAFDASEVLGISGNTVAITGVSLSNPSVLKVDPIVNGDEKTVLFPVVPGTDLTSLSPVFSTAEGVTSSPASGTTVNLSSNVTYILRSNGVETARWTMKAVEMRSPVLPGLYADPNIAVFGRTYYIYATTDGYSGWGGNVFYVWKSSDLVNWSRSGEPFLTLNGTSGNVPWASGNAWAPTITERNGKYYFYFSGHNPTYNRKTIGVAVANSPEGPFTAQSTAMILNNESVTSGQAIDPCAFHDPVSGKYYLYWGNGSPVYSELADNMTSLKSGTLKAISGLTDFREGSFVVYRQGLYHMTYSIDDTGSENYRIGYATATSATGPWTYRGLVLQKDPDQGILATGHNSIVNVPGTDDWYIAYHRFAIPGGDGTHRETTIDRLYFDDSTGLIKTVIPTLSSVDPETVPLKRRSRVFRG